jgi:hypothetical protein
MSAAATAAFAVLIKEAIANMPDSLNTKKEIDEYYKKAMKDINDKMKDEKKALKKAEPKAPKEPKEPKAPKEPKKRVKKAAKAKPVEVDADGNEIVKVKKPLNKYQMFIQQQRPKVKEDYPELSGEEIFTKIAELWKQHKEGADNKSDEKEIKKIEKEIKKIDDEIKKIDSDSDADKASDDANASDSGESKSGNESEVDEADDADADEVDEAVAPAVAVVATATPAPEVAAVADKKVNASGGKAPRKALSVKPAKAAK